MSSSAATDRPSAQAGFPVGYHDLHPDISMNFQMNRWFGWVGEEDMLAEMRDAATQIVNYPDWTREFTALAERSEQQGHLLRSGFYWRAAEFFMRSDDPRRRGARQRFLEAMRSVYGASLGALHEVPYSDGGRSSLLPAYRLTPAKPKCTVVFFGGFDSYVEEVAAALVHLRDAGFDVIGFEGPGQGGALHDAGLPMTAHWHQPVAAVLDHFGLDQVALVGLSLGGCLAVRAAAFEPRVAYVAAYDVLTNFRDVSLRQAPAPTRLLLQGLLRVGAKSAVNWMVGRVARTNPVVQWGIEQGMHVTGTHSAFDFLRSLGQYETDHVSAAVRQHALVMAGHDDHYVPLEQWRRQIRSLQNARSITARLFTRCEYAQNHCQVGNYGLALRTIVSWLDGLLDEGPAPLALAIGGCE